MQHKKITIIGLGLIGGSLAKALHERLGIKNITAINENLDAINSAIEDGTICRGFTELNEYVWDSDIIFICTPVKHTILYINALMHKVKPECIISDVGSTKGEIINYINALESPPCFIGGHPMAGTEKSGYNSSFSHLFENAYYILTPCNSTTKEAMECLNKIVMGIGGIPIVMESDDHDRVTGSISHVPHIIASTLVNMVREMDSSSGTMQTLAAGGFKDITRIASSSPEMWENITSSNSEKIIEILNIYISQLDKFKSHIENKDNEKIYSFFEHAKNFRDSLCEGSKGLITPANEIIIDVVDKPGIIGEITTILGNNNVNIKNISVLNSREFEQGCLRITLADYEDISISYNLLVDRGYKVDKHSS